MGTSLLRQEPFGEQRKADQEVVGHPASLGGHWRHHRCCQVVRFHAPVRVGPGNGPTAP